MTEERTLMEPISIYQQVANLLGETYGVDPEELHPGSDLTEDIDLKSDVESLAKFVHSLNTHFDIELTAGSLSKGMIEERITIVQDVVNEVEDALLE